MTATPRVWIGCLACYNGGRLTGEWFDAIDANDITTEQLHGGETDHEELWVMDHEYLPIDGECSPSEAAEWGEVLDACLTNMDLPLEVILEITQDLGWSSPSDLDYGNLADLYVGTYDDFSDYARTTAEDTMDIPEHLFGYFDWDQFERDIQGDYYEVSYGGKSFIFAA